MTEPPILQWCCVDTSPMTWAKGILENGRIYNVVAVVERRKDGSWDWAIKGAVNGGREPSRDTAIESADLVLEIRSLHQKVGAAGQQQGALALRRAGVEQVEHIGTPIKRTPHPEKKWAELGYAKVVYGEEVAADHRGVLPGGRSVLAEVKTVFDGNLTWTHFKSHQPGKLTEHAEYGGLSVVVWVSPKGCFILRWPIPGFRKGKGVTLEQAEALDLVDLRPFAKGG